MIYRLTIIAYPIYRYGCFYTHSASFRGTQCGSRTLIRIVVSWSWIQLIYRKGFLTSEPCNLDITLAVFLKIHILMGYHNHTPMFLILIHRLHPIQQFSVPLSSLLIVWLFVNDCPDGFWTEQVLNVNARLHCDASQFNNETRVELR
jgi:hypothetical protein